jgi:hypothetical protein
MRFLLQRPEWRSGETLVQSGGIVKRRDGVGNGRTANAEVNVEQGTRNVEYRSPDFDI